MSDCTPKITSPPSIDQVLEATKTLYGDSAPQNTTKEMISQWLISLQSSLFAWEIADKLLILKQDIESCYFAAQTLRTKLLTSFSELPPDAYVSLRNSIINHLRSIDDRRIQTQLALCITYLAIQDSSWTNPADDLFASGLNCYVLVEILTLLPEELNTSQEHSLKGVGAARRQNVMKYLTSIGPKIVTFLNTTLANVKARLDANPSQDSSESDPNTKLAEKLVAKIYRCLGAWLKVLDSSNINIIEPLLSSIFQSLQNINTADVIHDAAADTVCGAALLCQQYNKFQQLAHYLSIQICQLEQEYQASVASEDIDKSVNYSRIFTELAEAVIHPLIIESTQENFNCPVSPHHLISLVLRCIDHYEYEVAEITFRFWSNFAEFLLKRDDNASHLYGQYVMKLLDGLAVHCQLDTDQETLLSSQSDIYEFRIRVKDLIKEVIVIIGAANYLRHNNIVTNLKVSFTQMVRDQSNWEQDEAYLFMIDCLIKDIYEDNALVTEIVNLILTTQQYQSNVINANGSNFLDKPFHPQIFATCCRILGQLDDWLEHQPHEIFKSVLNYLLPFVTTPNPVRHGLSNNNTLKGPTMDRDKSDGTTLSSIAAQSLQNIIGCCASKHLVGDQEVIHLFVRLCTQLDSLNENAAHNLLQCCATMITQSSEYKNRIDQELLVVKILEPSIMCLNRIVTGTHENFCKSDPVIYMDRVSSVFRTLKLKPRDPKVTLNESPLDMNSMETWKLLEAILKHISSSSDTRSVERACRTLRYIIRCLRPIHLLIPVAECIVGLYSQFPHHSCYLYLASILVDEFGNTKDLSISDTDREKIDNGLLEMLQHFWRPTFSLLTSPQVELRNHPETIDDFFRLCTRYLQKNPQRFLSFTLLGQILELTLASLQLDHRDANTSVCKFIIELIEKGRSTDLCIKSLVDNSLETSCNDSCYGQKLVNTLISCALFVLPKFYIPDLSDILWNLFAWDKIKACNWLEKTLHSLSIHATPTSPDVAPKQIQEFYDDVRKASHLKLVVAALRTLSKGYR